MCWVSSTQPLPRPLDRIGNKPDNVVVDWQGPLHDGVPHFALIDWGSSCGFELENRQPHLHQENECRLEDALLSLIRGSHYLFRSPWLFYRHDPLIELSLFQVMQECLHQSEQQKVIVRNAGPQLQPISELIRQSPEFRDQLAQSHRDQKRFHEVGLLQRNDQWATGMVLLYMMVRDDFWWTHLPGVDQVNRILKSLGFEELTPWGSINAIPGADRELIVN